ncbi:hypothetical protein ACJMK2_009513 [Sinanodonta woodiana]|uniref:B(0,+)-type amino acid transporter 1 n=1 Tax=Sinanodonta woodiana TaxID=1069815 RepID=A0ABD3VCK0_SINWO
MIEAKQSSAKEEGNVISEKNVKSKLEMEGLQVKRRIGLLSSITFIVGAIIASLVYAELATMLPKSGGDYSYIMEAFGDCPAFLIFWSHAVIGSSSNVVLPLVFADYLCALLFGPCGVPDIIRRMIAAIEMLTLTIVNVTSVRLAVSVQAVCTISKVCALLVIILGGIISLCQGKVENISNGFDGTTTNITSYALAFYSCMWAYGGWYVVNNIAEEVKNPKRNIPKGIVMSMVAVTVIYLLANVSYFTILSKKEFLASSAVAYSWGKRVIGSAAVLIPISVMFSVYGTSNGSLFSAGRLYFAAARNGHSPAIMAYLHIKSLIPVAAVVFPSTVSILLLAYADITELINFIGFISFTIHALVMVSDIKLRLTRKELKPTFKVPLVIPIVTFFICIFMIVAPFLEKPNIEFLYGVAIIFAGLVFYFIFVYFRKKIPGYDWLTLKCQILLEVSPTSPSLRLN